MIPPSNLASSSASIPTSGRLDPKYVSLIMADPDRLAEITSMHALAFPPPLGPVWGEDMLRPLLENPASVTFIARVGFAGANTGFIIGQVAADASEIVTVGVTPEWQRRGIGAHLIGAFGRAASRAGATRLFLEVAEDNEAAFKLYSSIGCAEVGRRKGYYQRAGAEPVDAIVMSKPL
jgi:[ribosomal protein S18]-alanine N-acetyltransferase